MKKSLLMYCVTNKHLAYLDNLTYKKAGVGNDNFPKHYYLANSLDNIFYKERYYSELTFHYWYWKNLLKKIKKNTWIGFCQKRKFWLRKESFNKEINIINLRRNVISHVPKEWNEYDAIIGDPIFVNNMKKMKRLKRGLKSLLKDPTIFFDNKKQTVKLHFDMHHGYGNFDKAVNLLNNKDRVEFRNFANTSNSFNPHIMFISTQYVANKWFSNLFPWLFRCEKEFGFKNLKGYDTTRLYAYLAERYLSFWFRKYTKFIEWPIVTLKHY